MASPTAVVQPAIAGYRDLRLIGSGGFSKVYTAYQERFARTVAVKVITAELSDDARRRFRREQLTAGQLDGHPHIIRVYESGTTDDGLPYLTMEYHEQGSLSDRVRRNGPLPVDEVLRAGVKLACALEAAHRRGIVHRDVKPQNVLLSPFVGPILADFGIAAFDDARMQTTTSEAFSVFHVAPEVLDGHPATPAADLYALVSTLYELLAGKAPFAGDTDQIHTLGWEGPSGRGGGGGGGLLQYMRRVRTGSVAPIDRPDVPPALGAALVTLMARDPGGRPRSALALAERLRQLEVELGLPSTPLVGVEPAPVSVPPESAIPPPSLAPPGQPAAASSPPAPSGPQAWVGTPGKVSPIGPTPQVVTPVGPRPGPIGSPGPPPGQPGPGPGPELAAGDPPAPPTEMFRRGPSRPPAPADDGPRRNLWLAVAGAGLLVALIGGGTWLLLGRDDPGGGTQAGGGTTTTAIAAGSLPPCPGAAEGLATMPTFEEGVPPTWLEVEVSGDGTAATIRWDDPNAARSSYVVFASCDAPESDNRIPVHFAAAGEATEFTLEDLGIEHNYCFSVGVLRPTGSATPYQAEDGTHYRCLDGTTR